MRARKTGLASMCALALITSACGGGEDEAGVANTICSDTNSPDAGVFENKIVIGGMSDLTGPASPVHIPHVDGIKAYFHAVNEKGGINGRTIEYKVLDDQFVPEKGRANYRQLADGGYLAIAPINGSSVLTPLLPLIQEDGMPVVGPSHTINEQLLVPSLFNLMPLYSDISEVAAAYAVGLSDKVDGDVQLGVFSNDVPSAYEWGEFQKEDIENAGATFTEHVTTESTATQAQAQMRKLLEADTNVLSLHGPPTTASLALQEQAAAGTTLPMVASFPVADNAVWESNEELGKDLAVVLPVNGPDGTTPGGKELITALQAIGVKEPYSWWHTFGWINGMTVAHAIEEAGCEVDRDSFVKALNEAPPLETGGLSGDVDFDDCERIGISGARPYSYNYESSQLEGIGEFADWADSITGKRYEGALPQGC